jgi:hypothetical protein
MTKSEKRMKALELAVDLLKGTTKFTNKDVIVHATYFYKFLVHDIETSIKRFGIEL